MLVRVTPNILTSCHFLGFSDSSLKDLGEILQTFLMFCSEKHAKILPIARMPPLQVLC